MFIDLMFDFELVLFSKINFIKIIEKLKGIFILDINVTMNNIHSIVD